MLVPYRSPEASLPAGGTVYALRPVDTGCIPSRCTMLQPCPPLLMALTETKTGRPPSGGRPAAR